MEELLMGYTADGKLEDFFHPEPMIEAGRRTVERVGADLKDRVTHHTPIAKPPSGSVAAEWEQARKRPPGTLHESWQIGEVTVTMNGARMTIPVYTEDPIAPYVEWDTQPHLIVPKDQLTGVLRYWDTSGNIVFTKIVHHPGTRGTHMLATALVEVAASWQTIGMEEMERWAHEQLR